MGNSLRGVLLVRSRKVGLDAHGCWTGAINSCCRPLSQDACLEPKRRLRLDCVRRGNKDRSDSHEGDKRHSTPQPLDAVDLLRRAAVDVRERRRKQHELDDPRTTKGAFSLAVRLLQFLLRDMMITSMILPSFTCSCACSCMRNPLRSRVSVSQTRDGVSIRDTVPFRSGLGWAGSYRG
jgi:hypothetical protein